MSHEEVVSSFVIDRESVALQSRVCVGVTILHFDQHAEIEPTAVLMAKDRNAGGAVTGAAKAMNTARAVVRHNICALSYGALQRRQGAEDDALSS